MKVIKPHIITTFVSQLLITAIVLTLFFGQGVHLHFSFHDLFDHHDNAVVMHSHDSSEEDQNTGSSDTDTHQHSVTTIEFNGNVSSFAQSTSSEFFGEQSGVSAFDDIKLELYTNQQFAIPPPLPVVSHLSTSSLSLRAPPQA